MITWSVNLNPNRLAADLDPVGLAQATPGAFAQLEALGAKGIRVDLFWRALEPRPGEINNQLLRWYRDFFSQAGRRGIQVYALMYHPPDWAMALLPGDPVAFLEAWRGFCRLVGEEFGSLLTLVQPWNEPNNFLAALKRDPVLFHTRSLGPVALPVGVPWETLSALFRIAREELPPSTRIVFNVLANLCPFLPAALGWLDWERFADTFMARAGEWVDVVALDHYPDTWAPGTGPHEWDCLDVAAAKARDPNSPWYRKTVALGEIGYSSAPNFHLVTWPIKLARFFPGDRDEGTMARWYARALVRLGEKLTKTHFPHNQDHWVNLYELFDPLQPVGGHPLLVIEDHFGLVRCDYTRKPAFEVVKAAFAGTLEAEPLPWKHREPLYWRLARWGRALDSRLRPAPAYAPMLERVVPLAQASEPARRGVGL
jgi:hypothetical protein